MVSILFSALALALSYLALAIVVTSRRQAERCGLTLSKLTIQGDDGRRVVVTPSRVSVEAPGQAAAGIEINADGVARVDVYNVASNAQAGLFANDQIAHVTMLQPGEESSLTSLGLSIGDAGSPRAILSSVSLRAKDRDGATLFNIPFGAAASPEIFGAWLVDKAKKMIQDKLPALTAIAEQVMSTDDGDHVRRVQETLADSGKVVGSFDANEVAAVFACEGEHA